MTKTTKEVMEIIYKILISTGYKQDVKYYAHFNDDILVNNAFNTKINVRSITLRNEEKSSYLRFIIDEKKDELIKVSLCEKSLSYKGLNIFDLHCYVHEYYEAYGIEIDEILVGKDDEVSLPSLMPRENDLLDDSLLFENVRVIWKKGEEFIKSQAKKILKNKLKKDIYLDDYFEKVYCNSLFVYKNPNKLIIDIANVIEVSDTIEGMLNVPLSPSSTQKVSDVIINDIINHPYQKYGVKIIKENGLYLVVTERIKEDLI